MIGPLLYAAGDNRTEGTLLCNRGTASFEMGQTQVGLDYLNQSVSVLRAAGERRIEESRSAVSGEIYSALGEQNKALDNFNLSLGSPAASEISPSRPSRSASIARVKRDLNQAREARRDIEVRHRNREVAPIADRRSAAPVVLLSDRDRLLRSVHRHPDAAAQ